MPVFHITNLAKQKPPKIAWQKIAKEILGKKYDLSVVLADNTLMRKLNKTYRNKNKPASVLSFNLNKQTPRFGSGQGEIFINLEQSAHLPIYLFIHALCHLKGFEHSARMEMKEQRFLKKYYAKHYHRPRHRNISSQNDNRRKIS